MSAILLAFLFSISAHGGEVVAFEGGQNSRATITEGQAVRLVMEYLNETDPERGRLLYSRLLKARGLGANFLESVLHGLNSRQVPWVAYPDLYQTYPALRDSVLKGLPNMTDAGRVARDLQDPAARARSKDLLRQLFDYHSAEPDPESARRRAQLVIETLRTFNLFDESDIPFLASQVRDDNTAANITEIIGLDPSHKDMSQLLQALRESHGKNRLTNLCLLYRLKQPVDLRELLKLLVTKIDEMKKPTQRFPMVVAFEEPGGINIAALYSEVLKSLAQRYKENDRELFRVLGRMQFRGWILLSKDLGTLESLIDGLRGNDFTDVQYHLPAPRLSGEVSAAASVTSVIEVDFVNKLRKCAKALERDE